MPTLKNDTIEYNSYDFWFNSNHNGGGEFYKSRYIFEGLISKINIPTTGYCVQLGVHTGFTLNLMKKHFGKDRVIGIDLFNYNNDPCVYRIDINNIDFDLPLAYAENDVGWASIDPKTRYNAFLWSVKNLVSGGKLLTTSNVANDSFKRPVEDICIEHNCSWTRLDTFSQEPWARYIDEKTQWSTLTMMLVTKN